MPIVYIPPALRKYSNGIRIIKVEAGNIREVIAELEKTYPGMQNNLVVGDQLRPGLAVAIDSRVCSHGLLEKVENDSEVHFIPAVSGG